MDPDANYAEQKRLYGSTDVDDKGTNKQRPLGEHVPPSAGASLGCLVAGGLARRAGYRRTGNASIALGVGLAVGTLTSAKAEGGMLAAKA